MSMSVLSMQRGRSQSIVDTDKFRSVIEDHLHYIKSNAISEVVETTGRQSEKFSLDFTGLLIELNVPEDMHWVTMRVNGLHSPADYIDSEENVVLLKPTIIRSIYERHLTNLYQR